LIGFWEVEIVELEEIKRMNLREFRDKGFLLEANRQFFHPLGLALEIYYDNTQYDIDISEPVGLRVQDWRDDPEGCGFSDFTDEDRKKARLVSELRRSKEDARIKLFGRVIQTLD
jgi:hypothetical protein